MPDGQLIVPEQLLPAIQRYQSNPVLVAMHAGLRHQIERMLQQLHQRGDPAADFHGVAATANRAAAAFCTDTFAAPACPAGRLVLVVIIIVVRALVVAVRNADARRATFFSPATLKSHAVPAIAFGTNAVSFGSRHLYFGRLQFSE